MGYRSHYYTSSVSCSVSASYSFKREPGTLANHWLDRGVLLPIVFYLSILHLLQRLQTLLISPLNELSSTSFADVRQKQVDCVLHLLHSSGDIISFGWPLFLNIIGAINNSQGYNKTNCSSFHNCIHSFHLLLVCHQGKTRYDQHSSVCNWWLRTIFLFYLGIAYL